MLRRCHFTKSFRPGLEALEDRCLPSIAAGMLADLAPEKGGVILSSSPKDLVSSSGTLYFTADGTGSGLGRELWKTDGSVLGTVVVKDIHPGLAGSNPGNLAVAGSLLYFTADD